MFASNTSQASDATYIEDVFSTWLYTGNGSTQTITNGIDLAGKGGLVWVKGRSGATDHALYDTARGATKDLVSNSTAAETTQSTGLTAFSSTGFSLGALAKLNTNTTTYASWTFRKQPKFFDVVTYTGNGSNRTVAHNLGSVPGCIIVKRTDTTGAWQVYHRSLANTEYMVLNTTAAKATGATRWNSTTPTSTEFSLGTDATVNTNGGTYVAYLFAHNAGGFGLTGTDNVISCGSYTGTGTAGINVSLGYEPQFVIVKEFASGAARNWVMEDVLRGMSTTKSRTLNPNLTDAEVDANQATIVPTATGFTIQADSTFPDINNPSSTYIYIAIRRGPMKTPTSGSSVFTPVAYTGTGATNTVTSGFVTDLVIEGNRTSTSSTDKFAVWDRLRDINALMTTSTNTENSRGATEIDQNPFATMTGIKVGTTSALTNASGNTFAYWMFKRAPGYLDEVCYTGTGANRTVTHRLGVVPELMIVKRRDSTGGWVVYSASSGPTKYQYLNTTAAAATLSSTWNNTSPTASVFTVGTDTEVNASGGTFVAYLFATCPGVSKVGSYTGNGSSQTINCGFTGGARFLMIKRTDSTGDWYVWDTARGIVTGNDPRLSLNSTAAEVTTDDPIDPDNSGFIVNQLAFTNVNVNAATYIYLAIA